MSKREELQASSVQQSDKFPLAKFIPSLMSIPTWVLLYLIAALLGAIYTPEEQISFLPFFLVPTTITAIDFFLIITKILRKTPISMKSYTLVLMATHAVGAVFIAVAFVPDTYNGLFLIFVDSIGLLFLYNRAGFVGGVFFQILAVCIFATSKAIVGSPWESDDILVTIFCGFTLLAYCPFFEAVLRTKTKLRTKTRELLEEQKRLSELTITLDKQVHERTNDLRESNQELHRLNQQKTHFFQNISHELRTPLTLILNPLAEESARYPDNKNLEIAAKNSRRLLRLVNQLLDFQKLSAGKRELSLKPVNILRFGRICGDYFTSACTSKDIQFHMTFNEKPLNESPKAPAYILGNIDALEKVVFNFLSNALKYTPKEGRIELQIQEQEGRLRINVKDSGPGISEEGQTKLFKVFSQVDESYTREYEGTGLGLALARELTEKMNGTVGIESAVGEGSTFWVEFPVFDSGVESGDDDFAVRDWLLDSVSEDDHKEGDTYPVQLAEGDGQTVLVVDDLPDMRQLIASSLVTQGYVVIKAQHGQEALDMAKVVAPRLIVTDWMMPEMNGPELIKAIRSHDSLSGIPIILLTAKSDEESKLLAQDVGADAFLGKPFSNLELHSIVRNLLNLKRRETQLAEALDTLKKNQKEIIEAKNRAEAADRIKTRFVANMSHEIRTPMTAILGFADLLLEPQDTHATTKRIVETICRNGQHLLAIINDILDITKIEAGKMTVEFERFSPLQLFVEVRGLMLTKIKEKNLSLDIKFESPMPEFIFSDPTRFRQILVNLIGNAIKFTEEGTVTLTARLDDNDSSTDPQLVVSISDTGIGMTPEQAQRVFERFEQADTSTTRQFGGTGLGLSISHRLAALLNGDLSAQSQLGTGTTFTCRIATGDLTGITLIENPSDELKTIHQDKPSAYHATQSLKGRILVADDGQDNRALILFRLTQAGASVELATDGREAYDQALSAWKNGTPFDLVLMDMQMPEMDGYTATANLRREEYPGPIIALTANTMATDRERCLAAGCDDYAAKPIDFQHLISLAGNFMESELIGSESLFEEIDPFEITAQMTADSANVPLKSSYTDDPMMADLIEKFVNNLQSYCEDIDNGIKTSDLTVAQRRAHQLAGAGGSYGFGAITETAHALEIAIHNGDAVPMLLEHLRELYVLEERARLGLEK